VIQDIESLDMRIKELTLSYNTSNVQAGGRGGYKRTVNEKLGNNPKENKRFDVEKGYSKKMLQDLLNKWYSAY